MSFTSIMPLIGSFFSPKREEQPNFRDNTTNASGSSSQTTDQNTNITNQASGTTDSKTANKGFTDPVLGQIEGMLKSLLSGQNQTGNQGAVDNRVAEIAGKSDSFDVAGFVNGIVGAAASTMASDREQNLNALASKAGGGADGNSMLQLLASKMQASDAATLGGIKSAATKEATGIATGVAESKTNQLNQSAQTSNSMLAAILQVLAGQNGTTASSGNTTSLSNELQKLLQTTKGTTSNYSNTDYKGV